MIFSYMQARSKMHATYFAETQPASKRHTFAAYVTSERGMP
jgi:hypothetical protein